MSAIKSGDWKSVDSWLGIEVVPVDKAFTMDVYYEGVRRLLNAILFKVAVAMITSRVWKIFS